MGNCFSNPKKYKLKKCIVCQGLGRCVFCNINIKNKNPKGHTFCNLCVEHPSLCYECLGDKYIRVPVI